MKIYVGSDHRGFELKQKLTTYLKDQGYDVKDEGDNRLDPNDDFPQFANKVVSRVLASDEKDPRGILICGSGQGMCMAANRYKGIRAALGYSAKAAKESRNDDDSNILCLPAEDIKDKTEAHSIVETWLRTPFAGASRFVRRNKELDNLS